MIRTIFACYISKNVCTFLTVHCRVGSITLFVMVNFDVLFKYFGVTLDVILNVNPMQMERYLVPYHIDDVVCKTCG